jgi:hypothetical protein
MKCEAIVYIMAICFAMGTRLARIEVQGGCLGRIKTILLPMHHHTSNTYPLPPV